MEMELITQPWRMTPSITTPQFERVSEVLADKISDLLCARVIVIDEEGLVLSSNDSGLVGRSLEASGRKQPDIQFRIPFCVDGQLGEILIGRLMGGEQLSPRLAQVFVKLVMDQVALLERQPNRYELKNKFIYDLLHGLVSDEPAILTQARVLDLDLAPPRAVILIDAADYILDLSNPQGAEIMEAQIQHRAQYVISSIVSFFHLPSDTICAYLGDGAVAVLKASDTQNLTTWADSEDISAVSTSSWANLKALKRAADALLGRLPNVTKASINIGIGRYHPGISGLARSYQDACVALSLGRRFHAHNRIHCLDELGIAAFVGISDERTKIDLAVHLLSPLDYEHELLETLNTFFACDCCPSLTSSNLSIHRNTLSYRLDKISSLTGLDPRRFDDAVQIRLALLLRSLRLEVPL